LAAQGIAIRFAPFANVRLYEQLYQSGSLPAKGLSLARCFLGSAAQLRFVRQHDVVLIHRAISIVGPAILERVAALLRRPIIFDFDDAIYRLHTSDVNRWFGWLKFPGKTAAICRMSSHITVGNQFLAAFARQYNPNVTIIPSSVDTVRYRPLKRAESGGPVVVGWTGSSTSLTYLEQFASVLRQLLARRAVEIRVISDREPVLPGVPITWRRWSAASEAEDVGQFDIGIMPMPDDIWARGKCAFKALQYMAMEVPAVCSAVGTNTEIITHGENGFLATTADDWLRHLEELIDNALLRRRIGAAGRRTVECDYSMVASANSFGDVVRSVVDESNEGFRTESDRASHAQR
jgi:glycosyltransferase involved in cell wall biosynthesis